MSILIDDFIEEYKTTNYYIYKLFNKKNILYKIKDCWRILINKSIAVHFREDI